jgi:hypothetical protein
MDRTDEYLSHAAECQRMAEKSKLPGDKAAWLKLAESWLSLLGAGKFSARASHNGGARHGDTSDERPQSSL